jgi:hypothetical protein
MSSSNGWLSKIKGEKDIATSKEQAKADRKQRNPSKKKKATGRSKKPAATTATKKKQKKKSNNDDDYDYNDDDFVVPDGEVESASDSEDEYKSEGEEESDLEDLDLADDSDDDDDEQDNSDEEIELVDSPPVKKGKTRAERAADRKKVVQKRRGNTTASSSSANGSRTNPVSIDSEEEGKDSSDSSSDDDFGDPVFGGSSFLPNTKQRKSQPSNIIKQNQKTAAVVAKARSAPTVLTKKRRSTGGDSLGNLESKAKKIRMASKFGLARASGSGGSDDEELTSPEARLSKPALKSGHQMRNNALASSSDEESDSKQSSSKYFTLKKKKMSSETNESINDLDEYTSVDGKTAAKSLHCLEDTPEPPRSRKKTASERALPVFGYDDSDANIDNKGTTTNHKPTKKPASQGSEAEYLLVDSDEEESMTIKKKKKKKKKVAATKMELESDEDKDLQAALLVSRRQFQKDHAELMIDKEGEEEVLRLDDTDDDEEEGDVGDEYIDEEKKAASSVLQTAEQLSAQVVRTMSRWFGAEKASDGSQGGDNGTIQGILVDGALSLGKLGDMSSGYNDTDHEWISKEEMEKACPDVTLSDYQLIGVNWLSLLHGMKCKVGKKDTNVNGILADEMGLVRCRLWKIVFFKWCDY